MLEFIVAHPTLHTAIVYLVFCLIVTRFCTFGLRLLRVREAPRAAR